MHCAAPWLTEGRDGDARAGKYEPLTSKLRAAAARGQGTVDLDFDEVVRWWAACRPPRRRGSGGPTAAMSKPWPNAPLASTWSPCRWTTVEFRFSLGSVVGRDAGGHHQGMNAPGPVAPEPSNGSGTATSVPIDKRIDVRVKVDWTDGGTVVLDAAGKP